jgi:hypothetical protein
MAQVARKSSSNIKVDCVHWQRRLRANGNTRSKRIVLAPPREENEQRKLHFYLSEYGYFERIEIE